MFHVCILQVSLSLAEKQKLAKEQELQQQFKTQTPLMATPGSSKPQQQQQVRDLTSSLLNMDMMSQHQQKSNTPLLSSTAPRPAFANGGMSTPAAAVPAAGGWMGGKSQYQSLGAVAATGNINRASPLQQPMSAFPQPMAPRQSMQSIHVQRNPQMSSNSSHMNNTSFSTFDALSAKPMNNMTPAGMRQATPQSTQHNKMFGVQPMNTARQPFSGAQPVFGAGMGGATPMGGMGGVPYSAMGGNAFGQTAQQNSTTKKLSSQELADFLG